MIFLRSFCLCGSESLKLKRSALLHVLKVTNSLHYSECLRVITSVLVIVFTFLCHLPRIVRIVFDPILNCFSFAAHVFLHLFVYYAPNFEKVGGAYCFWLVHSYIRLYIRTLRFFMPPVTFEPCMLGSGNFAYEKLADPYFFLVRVMPLSGVMLL